MPPPRASAAATPFWAGLRHRLFGERNVTQEQPTDQVIETPGEAVRPERPDDVEAAVEQRVAGIERQLLSVLSKLDVFAIEVLARTDSLDASLAEAQEDRAKLREEMAANAAPVERLGRLLDQLRCENALLGERLNSIVHSIDGVRQDCSAIHETLEAIEASAAGSTALISEKLDSYAVQVIERQRPPAFRAGDNVIATEVDGFILGIPADEWRLAAYYVFRGVLEPGMMRLLQRQLSPGAVFADVGANIGIVTLLAARLVGAAGKVYSFEPTPRIFSLLKDNVQVNGFLETGCIDLRQIAVLDKSGRVPLYIIPANSGHNTLYPGSVTECEKVEVDSMSLDEALPPGSRVDMIKIDAEGSEPLIWRGMRRILHENPTIGVVFEFAPSLLRRAGHDPSLFLDEIAAQGFRIWRINDISGDLVVPERQELLTAFSPNLFARRDAPTE
jgi:FkbM family methyltransferase